MMSPMVEINSRKNLMRKQAKILWLKLTHTNTFYDYDDDGDGINNAWENDNDTSDEKKQ